MAEASEEGLGSKWAVVPMVVVVVVVVGSIQPNCCRLVSWMSCNLQFQLIQNTSQQQFG
jgi:hypothetical protein